MSEEQPKKAGSSAVWLVVGALVLGGAIVSWERGWIGPDQMTEEALVQRAQLFWDRKTSGDTMGAYEMMAESYRKRVGP
ncbi:MAG TPA: hypothetical protein DCG06_00545, partial [Deltaproteobacteria bacterium]|nr:hypothetical protein [Deltaproteobacteria bacterium]